MFFNNVRIKDDILLQTRNYFIELNESLIEQVLNGSLKVNDIEKYIDWKKKSIEYYKNTKIISNFTFLQYAYFLQTGECIALLK